MRRPVWFRVLISLWGIWFATALTEPAGLFACAMHSGISAASTAGVADVTPPATTTADIDHAAAHDHADAAAPAPQVDTSTPDHSEHSCCTCLGQCCTMSPATVPFTNHEVVIGTLAERVVLPFADTAHSPQRSEHLLPFANGPPRIA